MQLLRHHDDCPPQSRGAVAALGNFDGVHRGHQAVIGQAARLAADRSVPFSVITFEPHPREFFQPDADSFRLTPFRNKSHHLEALGIDLLVCLSFDKALSSLTGQEFIDQILVGGLGLSAVIVGYDFRFGKGRDGDVDLLKADSRFETIVVDPEAAGDGTVYSSTKIREFLETGQPGHAAALLGRPFEIEGEVIHGDQRGRTIGFPTANLKIGDYIRPAYGVYAVRAGVETGRPGEAMWIDGVANLGKRPTVDGLKELFEIHLFDFERDLYGTHLRVALIEFIRPEQKFDSFDALKAQIELDGRKARLILDTRAAGA